MTRFFKKGTDLELGSVGRVAAPNAEQTDLKKDEQQFDQVPHDYSRLSSSHTRATAQKEHTASIIATWTAKIKCARNAAGTIR